MEAANKGAQDADGLLKLRVNGEDTFLQLYNAMALLINNEIIV